jgi:TolB protein
MHRLQIAAIAAASLMLAAPLADAQDTTRGVRIGLTYAAGSKPGVLVLPVRGALGDSLRAILQRDLDYGDRVTALLADVPAPGSGTPNYGLYAQLGAAALVQATQTAAGVHVAVHDVANKSVLQVADFPLPATMSHEWRMAVHGVSDEVERWITGTRGIAQSQILFVRGSRVHVIDSDGAGERPVTDVGRALSPAWHPDGERIAFSVLGERGTQIYLQSLRGGAARRLGVTSRGLNITPTFSPDGATLVYAHGEDEGTDLMSVPVGGGAGRRITVGRGTDNVSPSFSPDGRRIAFTSGRSGHPEVYIMDADGTNAELLTPFNFGDQYYRSNPDWSPDGRLIAFQSQIEGRFQVMTISLRDRSIKQHTSEGANEDPSWAPDARHLVFTSTRTGTRQLFVLDVESGRVRQLTRSGGARLAAWSGRMDRGAPGR